MDNKLLYSATNDPTTWSNPDYDVIKFASPEDAKKAERMFKALGDEIDRLSTELMRYEEALEKIEDFTTGYGDVAGIVCKVASKALRPESS